MKLKKRVILFQVKSSSEKIKYICKIAKKQFDLHHKLHIQTTNEQASIYVDSILWSYPKDSFVPHKISLTTCEEIICISHLDINSNGANTCFNLTNRAILNDCFSIIYDFEVYDTKNSSQISEEKIKLYKEASLSIASF